MQALATDSGVVIATQVEFAASTLTRMRGLLGREGLAPGHVLLLEPCRAVHTVGMRFTLDLIFVDTRGVICRTAWAVAPQRLMVWGGWKAAAVYEAASGWLTASALAPGTRLCRLPAGAAVPRWSPSPPSSAGDRE